MDDNDEELPSVEVYFDEEAVCETSESSFVDILNVSMTEMKSGESKSNVFCSDFLIGCIIS